MRRHRTIPVASTLALAILLAGCPENDPDPIDPEPLELEITTTSLEDGAIGEAYTAGVDAEGGDGEYEWSVSSGALPPGLDLSVEDLTDDDVLITGLPEQEGSFTFRLRVTSEDGQADTRLFTIDIVGEPAPITIETPALPPALAGANYRTGLEASGGDGTNFTWEVVGGTLPPGLSLVGDSIIGSASTPDTSIVVLRVSSGGFETETAFTIQIVANRTSTYDITVLPVVPVPGAIQPSLDAAITRWQQIITGDVSQAAIPGSFFDPGDCAGFGTIINGTSADDIIVMVNITSIDGPGQVLGQAGPCVIRSNGLPFAGVLTLDSDDLLQFSDATFIRDLIIHEVGHVLGFGSLWEFGSTDLLGGTSSDPRFTGSNAVAAWNALGGTGQVPVEDTGGQGTADSHWRESIFNRELMTGFAEQPGTPQPISRVTIASLDDLGYTVNLNAADAFTLGAPMGAAAALQDRVAASGYDVVLRDIIRVDESGTRITPRLEVDR